MRSVTYSMGVSLDGYIVGPDGNFGWSEPDEELFHFVTHEIREVGVHLLGRRLYETMLYWETAGQDSALDELELEWATIWNPLPKVVFSTTLSSVQGNARLASGVWLRRSSGCEPSRGRVKSRSAEQLLPLRRPHWVWSMSTGPGSTRCWLAVVFRSFPNASAEWISNSSKPAPSAQESSTSATAWRARCTDKVALSIGLLPGGRSPGQDLK